MHFHHEILVKAENKDEARMEVDTFLDSYGEGRVWDWYVIGGRWTGIHLSQKERDKLFEQDRFWETCEYCKGTGNRKDMPEDDWKKECNGCNVCRGKGKKMKYSLGEVEADVLRVSDDKERARELIKEQEKYRADAREWVWKELKKIIEKEGHKNMEEVLEKIAKGEMKDGLIPYYIKEIGTSACAYYYETDSYFFDVEDGSSTMDDKRWAEVLKEGKDYYLVTVDLHN